MTQIFLDPETISTSNPIGPWSPDGPIPEAVRTFGYCISFKDLEPGDLILFSSVKPSLISRGIRRVQRKGGYKNDDARWEHAAVYIMSDTICEASRSGVKVASLYSYIGTHKIRVRRNLALSPDEKWSLVVNAIKQGDYAYGYSSIVGLLWKSLAGYWTKSKSRRLAYPRRAVYCSELYADAHLKACYTALGNPDGGETTPASLSLDSALTDVQTHWVTVV